MKIFAISDLHLSFANAKPMEIFGEHWRDHPSRIETAWREMVGPEDWVLMGGDLSWAMRLEEALPDLHFVEALPGRKLMVKGNHEYWWGSRKKVEERLPPSIRLLQNDSFLLPDGTCIVGTRGWTPPGRAEEKYEEQDRKIYDREVLRLALSIQSARKSSFRRLWALIHFPPLFASGLETAFVPLLEGAGVELCVYGHLHGRDHASGFVGEKAGIRYVLAAVDFTGFEPVLLSEGLCGDSG